MNKKQETTEDTVDSKRFEGLLILDYRSKNMRVIKNMKLQKKLKPFEIAVKIDITLKIPRNPEIVAKGEFEIPAVKVREMLLDSI